jgi:hypothetical protein
VRRGCAHTREAGLTHDSTAQERHEYARRFRPTGVSAADLSSGGEWPADDAVSPWGHAHRLRSCSMLYRCPRALEMEFAEDV